MSRDQTCPAWWFVSLCLLMPQFVSAAANPVDLAELGEWDIVTSPDAAPSEQYAAQELQQFLEQAIGSKLDIVHSANRSQRCLFVGQSQGLQTSPLGFSTDQMGPEDFRIIIRDQAIAIAGGRPRGTLYGVYTFLEDYAGVRFLTADHTFVPKIAGRRVVGPVDRAYHPPLAFRWAYYLENSRDPAFATRLRNNTITGDAKLGGKTGIGLINHSFGRQIPSQKYGKEHPEYFAEIDGKRLAPVENDWHQTEPCLTNPDVLKIVTAAVLEELKANPKLENISVSQNDNDKNCRCANCRALDEREGTPMGSLLTFVNAVADEVAKHYPNVKVGTLSYWYTRKPPKTIRPRPNVQIQLCSIECCVLHPIDDPDCPKNREFCRDVDEWGRICSNISIWNYNTNFQAYQLPFPNLPVIEPNIRYFVANQARGIFMQAAGDTTGSAFSDLHNYVISNLLWDPNRSDDQLRDEFIRLHYGRAATPIRRIIELSEDQSQRSGRHRNCFGIARVYGLDEALAHKMLQHFEEALELSDDETVRSRVEKASICAYRLAIEPCWPWEDNATVEPALAERMREPAKHFFNLCEKYQVGCYREGRPTDEAKQRIYKLLAIEQ